MNAFFEQLKKLAAMGELFFYRYKQTKFLSLPGYKTTQTSFITSFTFFQLMQVISPTHA